MMDEVKTSRESIEMENNRNSINTSTELKTIEGVTVLSRLGGGNFGTVHFTIPVNKIGDVYKGMWKVVVTPLLLSS